MASSEGCIARSEKDVASSEGCMALVSFDSILMLVCGGGGNGIGVGGSVDGCGVGVIDVGNNVFGCING